MSGLRDFLARALSGISDLATKANGGRMTGTFLKNETPPQGINSEQATSKQSAASRIVVVGIGGCGMNVLNNIILSRGLPEISFIAVSHDLQALQRSVAKHKILLASEEAEISGNRATMQTLEHLPTLLEGAEAIFIIAGMGGSTGSKAAPIIAKMAKDTGALFIGFVTRPFFFEGKARREVAEASIAEFRKHVDSLVVIPNDNLLSQAPPNASFLEMLKKVDDAICKAVRGMSELLHGLARTSEAEFVQDKEANTQEHKSDFRSHKTEIKFPDPTPSQGFAREFEHNLSLEEINSALFLTHPEQPQADRNEPKASCNFRLIDPSVHAENPEKANLDTPAFLRVPLFSFDRHEPIKKGAFRLPHSLNVAPIERGKILVACLADCGIKGELRKISVGSAVTEFYVRIDPALHTINIENFASELADNLEVMYVCIHVSEPESNLVIIEMQNTPRTTVSIKKLLNSQLFRAFRSPLALALGKDTSGYPVVADLATLPHLLLTGANRTGMSTCINAIMLSILHSATPKEVRFILLGSKQTVLTMYEGLPHLLHPVVTNTKDARNALTWLVQEAERRQGLLKKKQAGTIHEFNTKSREQSALSSSNDSAFDPFPYIVVIIDELSDMMRAMSKDFEDSIARLSLLAPLTGVHLILATEQPHAHVTTARIQEHISCSIAFQSASRHNSRVILDMVGTEKRLDRGDALLQTSNGAVHRIKCAYVSDKTVQDVVAYWKRPKT